MCLTLLLFPCSSNPHLTKESSSAETRPWPIFHLSGVQNPLKESVSFLLFIPFLEFYWLKPGSSALVAAWSWVESVSAAGEWMPGSPLLPGEGHSSARVGEVAEAQWGE